MLPRLLVWLTGHARYRPEIEWSSRSWTHNVFRAYECLFWRRYGIRAESATWKDEAGKVHVQCFSIEAVCAYAETFVRQWFSRLLALRLQPLRVEVLHLARSDGSTVPWVHFAIALDVATDGGKSSSTAGPWTWSHTCTGSNGILFVHGATYTPTLTAVSYNSVAATQIDTTVAQGDANYHIYLYMVVGPSTGANTVSLTMSGTGQVGGMAISYSGASQTGQPDAHNHFSHASQFPTDYSWTNSITTIAANCWIVIVSNGYYGVPVASTGVTDRKHNVHGSGPDMLVGDSNGPLGSGSNSMTLSTAGGGGPDTAIMCSFVPATGGGSGFIAGRPLEVPQAVNRASTF